MMIRITSSGQSFVYLAVSVLNLCWGSRLGVIQGVIRSCLSTHIKRLASEMRICGSVLVSSVRACGAVLGSIYRISEFLDPCPVDISFPCLSCWKVSSHLSNCGGFGSGQILVDREMIDFPFGCGNLMIAFFAEVLCSEYHHAPVLVRCLAHIALGWALRTVGP